MKINASTALNLVIGNPVRHSQSPALHQQLYESLGINSVMLALENPALPDLIHMIKSHSIKLTAVTLPFKTAIIAHADSVSDEVNALGAANTLILEDNKIIAHNTDVAGIQASLNGVDVSGKQILILGAGGAARAVAYSLKDAGAECYFLNRTHEKAKLLAEQFGGKAIEHAALKTLRPDIIINATPIGMSPNDSETPLPNYGFSAEQTVFDLIYTPAQTHFLREAKSAGAKCINGETMFLAQAKKQVELAYGVRHEF